MTYLCRSFYELSLDQLYALLSLRQEIFIVEQDCPYLDTDGKDQASHHLMGFDEKGEMVTYTRLVPKGISYPEYVSIGRVVTSAKVRGKGLGKALMQESIDRCMAIFGKENIKISAQAHLRRFYEDLGFKPTGDAYLEDGIPHISMTRKPV